MEINSTNPGYNKEPLALSQAQELNKTSEISIKNAMETLHEERSAYTPTKAQLEENPWLKNAVTGLNKVSDILQDYKNGIDGSGESPMSMVTNEVNEFEILDSNGKVTSSYEINSAVEKSLTHLAWDDENYTKEGKESTNKISLFYSRRYFTENKDPVFGNVSFEVKNANKEVNIADLTEKLNSDKEFEKQFTLSMERYFSDNNSTKLIDYLKSGLGIEHAQVNAIPKTYDSSNKSNGDGSNRGHLGIDITV